MRADDCDIGMGNLFTETLTLKKKSSLDVNEADDPLLKVKNFLKQQTLQIIGEDKEPASKKRKKEKEPKNMHVMISTVDSRGTSL